MAAAKKPPLALMAILALALLFGGYIYMNFGSLITRTAEKIASNALGVNVDIGWIDISMADKTATVHSLKISNPPGYSKPHAMTAEKITIKLNTASKELIDFGDIQVKGSVVHVEVSEKGVNLSDLKNLANRKKQRESAGAKQVRVIIQHMVVEASTIHPSVSLLKHDIKPIQMPPVTFSKMGGGGGMEAGDAVVQVLTRYLSKAESAARQGGMLKELSTLEDVEKTLDDAGESIKGLFK
jgi:hypothetical protein